MIGNLQQTSEMREQFVLRNGKLSCGKFIYAFDIGWPSIKVQFADDALKLDSFVDSVGQQLVEIWLHVWQHIFMLPRCEDPYSWI